MKKRILQLSAVAALVAVSVSGISNISVSATVGSALTASNQSPANFGTTILNGSGAPLVLQLTPGGVLTVRSGSGTNNATGTAGSVTINGTGTASITIAWPNAANNVATGITFNGTDGTVANQTSCTLASGACIVPFGGTLSIAQTTATGTFSSSTLPVTLTYS